ncbi:non-ribosomal peptide synthetase [Ophiocordyceps camponoti-floridani]|uniref:Non-ribosomal peptide synthetase n=1 Tax=Ophiocordyceps camponoti-floridani TaxID=2030778 RepID=A0A8H4Q395_9HYPO|nr:non-ribosomal peptide synthetase [Ophiocordyceps camponoti-floridani]
MHATSCNPSCRRNLRHLSLLQNCLRSVLEQHKETGASALVSAAWALVVGCQSSTRDVEFGITSLSSTDADEQEIEAIPVHIRWTNEVKILDYIESAFPTLLVVQPTEEQLPEKRQNGKQPRQLDECALVIRVQLRKKEIFLTASFDSRVIDTWMMPRLLQRFEFVMRQLVVTSPDKTLAEVAILTPQDLDDIWTWNATVPAPVERCVHDMVEDWVQSQPTATAISAWDGELTYGELGRHSDRLADRLVKLGVGPDMLVPVCFEKSMWTTVAVLGVLKAGGAFILLNSSLPERRLSTMTEQIDGKFVVSSLSNRDLCSRLLPDAAIVTPASLTEDGDDAKGKYTNETRSIRHNPSSLLYAIFTSGSTGTPKGVMLQHGNLASALHHQKDILGYSNKTRLFDFSSYSFDVSVGNIFRPLSVGGCICVPSENDRRDNLPASIARFHADVAHITPSVAAFITPDEVPGLSSIYLGGEPLRLSDITPWWGRLRLINGYGPSECTPASTINYTASCPEDLFHMGKGAGVVTWIVDPGNHDSLLPLGCVGELLLEGPLVGLGYLNDQEKTSATFIQDPSWLLRGAAGHGGRRGRLYKTGDLVRYEKDGNLRFVGRKDTQAKINGQRVELGDIEHHVQKCMPEAIRVIVEIIHLKDNKAASTLAAFLLMNGDGAARHGQQRNDTAHILPIKAETKTKLMGQLPGYMVPTVFFAMDGLPMTATAKMDRRRLREIGSSFSMQDIAAATTCPGSKTKQQPTSEMGRKLQKIWGLVLNMEPSAIGLDDSFFELGGNSLRSMQLISEAHQADIGITMADIYRHSATSINDLLSTLDVTRLDKSLEGSSMDETAKVDLMQEITRHDSTLTFSTVIDSNLDTCSKDPANKPAKLLKVLLTGANGFVGTQILRQMLDHAHVGTVIALVRGKTAEEAKCRLINSAKRAMWWTDFHEEKLQVWLGDLLLPRLGLDPLHWELLAVDQAVDVIVHNGASVHWMRSYSSLEEVNIGSTMQLLRLAAINLRLKVVYISTGRQQDPAEELEEQVAGDLTGPDGIAYSQTKFVAEALVKRAARRNASGPQRFIVVSPGFVIGTPTEGVANADDYIWRLVASCIRIGLYNVDEADIWIPMSDAAATAAIVVQSAMESPSPAEPVRQVKGGMTFGEIWSILRGLGYRLEPEGEGMWVRALREDIRATGDEHPLSPLADMLHLLKRKDDWAISWRENSASYGLTLE